MIPYSYSMVDMGGIDLAEATGILVPGIYEKIQEAVNACGDVILYNWKFADIEIVPSHYSIFTQQDAFLINGVIQVTEFDIISVIGLMPEPVITPLEVNANGIFNPPTGVNGFAPVIVNVGTGQYEFLEYIESDGTQGINTGQIVPANSSLYLIFSPKEDIDFRWCFGAEYNDGYSGIILVPASQEFRIYNGSSQQFGSVSNIDYSGATKYSKAILTTNTVSNTNLWLFALGRIQGTDYRMSKIRMSMAALNQRCYLPVRRKSDGVCGVLDTYENQFLTDSLNGNPFVAGPVIL